MSRGPTNFDQFVHILWFVNGLIGSFSLSLMTINGLNWFTVVTSIVNLFLCAWGLYQMDKDLTQWSGELSARRSVPYC